MLAPITFSLLLAVAPEDSNDHSEVDRIGEASRTETDLLLQRGRWWMDGSFGWSSRTRGNQPGLLRLIDESERRVWDVGSKVGYQLFDFFALGLELSYATDRRTEVFTVDATASELESFQYALSVGPFARATLPISPFGIFYVYVDLVTRVGVGEQIRDVTGGGEREKELTNVVDLSAGVEPGLLVLLPSGVGVTAGIQLIGARAQWQRSELNRIEESTSNRVDVNFDINILTLNLAVLYQF